MGLGTVLSCDERTVTLLFLSCGETRTYAQASAPLTRVRFAAGDCIRSHEGWELTVETVTERDGLLHYRGRRDDGTAADLEEGQLDSFLQLNRPAERLFSGQVDPDKWFELRYRSRCEQQRLAASDLRGLTGARTSLIPHQLYIAHEVARRYAPRVLLADEVGLGKTIEAGLILHQQLLTGRAQRVLILLPESLVHQWFVEMLRKFNLHFSIFDADRCEAFDEQEGHAANNPFSSEQLVICDLQLLVEDERRRTQLIEAGWDLLVVDEAHHLQWTPQQASVEYRLVEQLGAAVEGVLLLTATPEQLGRHSHFARLRLLDPDRYPDFDAFEQEQAQYVEVAHVVDALLEDEALTDDLLAVLTRTLDEADQGVGLETLRDPKSTDGQREHARVSLLDHLLDRHGTGRVLFRNTRAAVQGFAGRVLHATPLPLPAAYAECMTSLQDSGHPRPEWLASPELLYQARAGNTAANWTELDPRIDWLVTTLQSLRPSRVLVITANADSAIAIASELKRRAGLHAAVFHEHLSIIERDRAAAYFADREAGTQVLVCSEIGSEGRNFQFAHHLVLFDLPINPDLLEQRIGRLDRIGQRETIRIHVPYLEDSPQEILFRWYHEGMDAIEHSCPPAYSVFRQLRETLFDALHQIEAGLEDLPALLATTRQLTDQLRREMHDGRDRLLEINSCRPHAADALYARARSEDAAAGLPGYLEELFDCFGVDSEDKSAGISIVRPGAHMSTDYFPALPEDGISITCDRVLALTNEDIQFTTWEHPLVTGAMDMVLSQEAGNSALTSLPYAGLPAGSPLLECIFVLETTATTNLHIDRYLPATGMRIVLDRRGRDHAPLLSPAAIARKRERVDRETARKVITAYADLLRDLLRRCEQQASALAPTLLEQAHAVAEQTLKPEIERLRALRLVNPNVRDAEIRFFEQQWEAVRAAIDQAQVRLDAVRVIVTT